MITINLKQKIILMFLHEGRSQREIAKLTGVHRGTVGKYINEYEEKRQQLLGAGFASIDIQALIDALTSAPKYSVGNRPKRKLTEEIEQLIQKHLDENEEKRKKGFHKQLKKATDIYEALAEENVDISYSTVLRTVRMLVQKRKEAYIKGIYDPGDICEFDWGEVKLIIGGIKQIFQMAAFTSAYGNYRYARLFTKQTTECFQEAHALFLEHIGGVYHKFVYDNMRVAIRRFVGSEKEPSEGLLKLSLYYGFSFRFCNVRAGNEKGHVERSVEVLRRKAFAFRDTFETLEEANAYLMEACRKRNEKPQEQRSNQSAVQCLEQERPYLLALPPMFDAARIENLRVDKYSTVMIDQNRYSVPDHLVGQMVMVKVYSNRVQVYNGGEKVAEHERLVSSHQWRMELAHYLYTLKKKPGALAGSLALHQVNNKIKKIYDTYYTKNAKDFIELMHFLQSTPLKVVEQAIVELDQLHPDHVTTDKIKVLCARHQEYKQAGLPSSEAGQETSNRSLWHLRLYDELFKTSLLEGKVATA